jgi:aspartate kinase
MMRIIVQKFGGSSVSTIEKIKAVAAKIVATRRAGFGVVAVVSAMGDTTDELLSLARRVAEDPSKRELDMLLSTGERISMALMSIAIQDLGEQAISFTGSQCGIMTSDSHAGARIIDVRPYRVQDELARGRIVIVAGYQGTSYKNEITTLGRGGSDTTAVALGAESCDIYSDVDGIYSADPRIVPSATKLAEVGYEEMQELARQGARVLNAQAVEFARQKGIALHAKSTFGVGEGTTIHRPDGFPDHLLRPLRAFGVRGVTGRDDVWVAELPPATPEALSALLAAVGSTDLLSAQVDAERSAARLVGTAENVHDLAAFEARLRAAAGAGLHFASGLASAAAVGLGVGDSANALHAAIEQAAGLPDAPRFWFSSRDAVVAVLPAASGKELQRRLHRRFLESDG